MGLLAGKNLLVTGVLTQDSIAYHVAELAQAEGARLVITGHGRLGLVRRVAGRLPHPAPVLELDVTDDAELASLAGRIGEHVDRIDGIVHAIAHAPASALGGNFLHTPWDDVAAATRISVYSLPALVTAVLPLLADSAAVVGLDFDAAMAWPGYDWMGVAKAGLESAARYLAHYLGQRNIRVNLVSAGPLRTMAAKSVPNFGEQQELWQRRAPLGWNVEDCTPVAKACVALLSDWFPATTGEIVHVDGGAHAVGS